MRLSTNLHIALLWHDFIKLLGSGHTKLINIHIQRIVIWQLYSHDSLKKLGDLMDECITFKKECRIGIQNLFICAILVSLIFFG